MNNTTWVQRALTVGLFSAAVVIAPLRIALADSEHEHEHEKEQECKSCGVVKSVQAKEQSSSGLTGAAAGAVAGGALGHQAGSSATGSTLGGMASALLGAVGGAVGGHYAEKAMTGSKSWTVTVKMEEGDTKTVTMTSEPKVKVGDHVQVKNDSVEVYQAKDD